MARDFGITNFRAGAAPTSPVAGDTYWDTTALAAYVWNGSAWVPMGGVPAPGPRPGPVLTNIASSQMAWQWPDTKLYVAQTGPGVSFAQFIRFNGSTYVAAQADTETNAEVVGLVVWVGSDEFVFQTSGIVTGLSGMTPGAVYYLATVSAGGMTPTEPTTPGNVSKPVLIALSATVGLLLSMRGLVIPAASGNMPKMYSTPVNGTGQQTTGTTELTIATLNVPALTWAYDMDCAFTLGGYLSAADSASSRIRVGGTQVAMTRVRGSGGNLRVNPSIPASQSFHVAANTAVTVTGTMQMDAGSTGVFNVENGAVQGALRANCWPS